jgi:diphosphomevalonate decarboxylase
LTKSDVVKIVLENRQSEPSEFGEAFAPANIALAKYWGKRDEELNLPRTSSLSVSLGEYGSYTKISQNGNGDSYTLNGQAVATDSTFARRLGLYLDLFRPAKDFFFRVETVNSIPTAAGLASSASGFAALAFALNDFFQWHLDKTAISILARLGSGSACRSVYNGFVEWQAGIEESGMDSFALPLPHTWPDLCLGLIEISSEEKPVSSRAGMKRTVETSVLYKSWPEKTEKDLERLKTAIEKKDFELLGQTAESNALAMHATMIAAWPPLLYWLPKSLETIHKIHRLRDDGLPVYFTMDAGANIKLLFEVKDMDDVRCQFENIKIIRPFDRPGEKV